MAEDDGAERNFPASPRRLEQAREKGQVARSRELATAAIAFAGAIGLTTLGPGIFDRCLQLFRSSLVLDRDAGFSEARMAAGLEMYSTDILLAMAPLAGLVLFATLAAPMLLSGWVWSTTALAPDWNRLNPVRGLSNIISTQGLAELVKAILKCLLLGAIGVWAVVHAWGETQALAGQGTAAAVVSLGNLVGTGFFALAGGLVVIALVDVPYQLWHYYDGLKMTREELREEQREQEGDPQLKARIRSQQREIARKRMMAAVPKADVIVTNPTHYAVALEYKPGRMSAPKVVAKGAGLIAQRIRDIGRENDVPLLEAPPLARALYRHAEIGSEIPTALYAVVAQVLAYVFQLKHARTVGGPLPVAPTGLDVPPELDPSAAA